jgi:hypothetical protein
MHDLAAGLCGGVTGPACLQPSRTALYCVWVADCWHNAANRLHMGTQHMPTADVCDAGGSWLTTCVRPHGVHRQLGCQQGCCYTRQGWQLWRACTTSHCRVTDAVVAGLRLGCPEAACATMVGDKDGPLSS